MDTPLILLVETATTICSTALSLGDKIVACEESIEKNAHSKHLSLMIERLFEKSKLNYKDLSAVAVSKGPGSYTGLRIGTSTAKGFSYALNIPLISIETLAILSFAVKFAEGNNSKRTYFLPMIDARRMEVYSAIYDFDFKQIKPISADIVEPNVYDIYLKSADRVIVCGDGAAKCKSILQGKQYVFADNISLSAKYMSMMAFEKYKASQFEDVAYFEPYYLKNFIAQPSHIKGLY
jgi:tRNA threonylcarbamoyladenosine biosynthesis protein TsaB